MTNNDRFGWRFAFLLASLLVVSACGDDDDTVIVQADAAMDADMQPDAMTDAMVMTKSPFIVPETTRIGMVASDYTATAISLLDKDAALLKGEWLTSGTTDTGISAALGGDVVMATEHDAKSLIVIDRFGKDVITQVTREDGLVTQVVAKSESAMAPNPQDVLYLSENSAWISRYNEIAEGDTTGRGNDLIEFDPSNMMLTGKSISLDSFSIESEDDQGNRVTIIAHPTRFVELDGATLLGTDRLPKDLFADPRRAGGGGYFFFDSALSEEPTFEEMDGVENCGDVQRVPGKTDLAIVICRGYSEVGFDDVAGTRATAGFALVHVQNEDVTHQLSKYRDDHILAVWNAAVIDEDNIVGVANENGGSQLYLNTRFGDVMGQKMLAESLVPGAFGQGRRIEDKFFLPDAEKSQIRVFEIGVDANNGTKLTETTPIDVAGVLPPRALYDLKAK